MPVPPKTNDYMTIRDDGGVIRGMLDQLRIAEAGGGELQVSRTEMLRRILHRSLEALENGQLSRKRDRK